MFFISWVDSDWYTIHSVYLMVIGLFMFSTSSWVNISKVYFSRHLSSIKFQIYWYKFVHNIPLLSYGYLQRVELCPPFFILDIIMLFVPSLFLLINLSRRLPSSLVFLKTYCSLCWSAVLYVFSFISFYTLIFFLSLFGGFVLLHFFLNFLRWMSKW